MGEAGSMELYEFYNLGFDCDAHFFRKRMVTARVICWMPRAPIWTSARPW